MTDNPSAFPSVHERPMVGGGKYRDDVPGMALRDWFAGQALAGLTGNSYVAERTYHLPSPDVDAGTARECYAFADAMLAERAK